VRLWWAVAGAQKLRFTNVEWGQIYSRILTSNRGSFAINYYNVPLHRLWYCSVCCQLGSKITSNFDIPCRIS
jgi:hypothetical protein